MDAANAKLKQSFTSLLASTQCAVNLAKEKQLKVEAKIKSTRKTNRILQKHLARIPDIKPLQLNMQEAMQIKKIVF